MLLHSAVIGGVVQDSLRLTLRAKLAQKQFSETALGDSCKGRDG